MMDNDRYSPEEVARRSGELLKHMLNRPPQPLATRSAVQPRNQKKAALDQVDQKNVSAETS
jgi:hypothetical protein